MLWQGVVKENGIKAGVRYENGLLHIVNPDIWRCMSASFLSFFQ
jgi:hypothetical protein